MLSQVLQINMSLSFAQGHFANCALITQKFLHPSLMKSLRKVSIHNVYIISIVIPNPSSWPFKEEYSIILDGIAGLIEDQEDL